MPFQGSNLINHVPSSTLDRTTFPDYLTPDLGVALMNLHLHGSVSVEAATELEALGLIRRITVSRPGLSGQALVFTAVELEFTAHLEVSDILLARATRHKFVEEAFLRMETDQYAGADRVVFERAYLEKLTPRSLAVAHRRSARDW